MALEYTVDRRPNYIYVHVDRNRWRDINDVERWCQQTGCGKRVNMSAFAFKSESDLTMFTLRWG